MTEKFLCAPVCMSVLCTLSKILAWRRSFNSFHSPILHSFFGVRVPFHWNHSALTWVWPYLFLSICIIHMGFFPFTMPKCYHYVSSWYILLYLFLLLWNEFCFFLPLLSFHHLPPTRLYLNRNLSLPLILALVLLLALEWEPFTELSRWRKSRYL